MKITILKTGLFLSVLILAVGCAQFANVDRSLANRPAMDLTTPLFSTNQSTLTNQKSSQTTSVGSCSVCAH